jgi:hypothetical protein
VLRTASNATEMTHAFLATVHEAEHGAAQHPVLIEAPLPQRRFTPVGTLNAHGVDRVLRYTNRGIDSAGSIGPPSSSLQLTFPLSLKSLLKLSLKNKQEIGHGIEEEIGALGSVCDADGGAGFGACRVGCRKTDQESP